MKLKFKTQPYQQEAVNAVADLFKQAEKTTTTFSIEDGAFGATSGLIVQEYGIGNSLNIEPSQIFANMQSVQKKNRLEQNKDYLSFANREKHFTIEMETGTGKTYVYTNTIFELNKRYGLTKFIIVVPSVAIREGVYKSLQITDERFRNLYNNTPYNYFIYDSKKLSNVRQFATSSNIEIMIINIDAFKKSENVINQIQDKLNGESAMRYIQDTNPVVIIDEPQSVDNTDKSKEAIASLNPLFVLRYSATHKEKINQIYSLTPVDAYNQGLVKQIVVYSPKGEDAFNKPYIALKSVTKEEGFKAKIEMDVALKNGEVKRKDVIVKPGDDLFKLSKERSLYQGYVITGMDSGEGRESIEFANTQEVTLNTPIGQIDENKIKQEQIVRTVETHLDKELGYLDKGIKVLSLFFIDKVDKYRTADGEKGIYAKMFESAYNHLIGRDKYSKIREKINNDLSLIHNGYFSQDKKGKFKDTKGDTLDDNDTYNTIMKDKEWLLSFECPLRFIFSHSALKEGWDNPNVFQVCTLIEQKSVFTQRQKIGRGLRLCVNQDGDRIEDKNINILHVMANESFDEFASTLQKEIEQETGRKFGTFDFKELIGEVYTEEVKVTKEITKENASNYLEALKENNIINEVGTITSPEKIENIQVDIPTNILDILKNVVRSNKEIKEEDISNITYTDIIIEEKEITYDQAVAINDELIDKKLLSKDGKMSREMISQVRNDNIDLGENHTEAIKDIVTEVAARTTKNTPPLSNASDRVKVKLKKGVILSPEFLAIWDKIKQKTSYRVNIDIDKLTESCVEDFKSMEPISKLKIVTRLAKIEITNEEVTHKELGRVRSALVQDDYEELPDIVNIISTETKLKRKDIATILKQSGRGEDFLNNPQEFTRVALQIILRNRHKLATKGISYIKLDGQEYYAQEIFGSDDEELDKSIIGQTRAIKMSDEFNNGVSDYVVVDSNIEEKFALSLDADPDVKMFFKIPDKFKIDTPIGSYNPDWAVYYEHEGDKKLYFVLETKSVKGIENKDELKEDEKIKIACGKEHFKTIANGEKMYDGPVVSWQEFKKKQVV